MSDLVLVTIANMGTPLLWQKTFHLLIGNLIIGVIEALILVKLFQVRGARVYFLLIIANYVSTVGWFLVFGIDRSTGLVQAIAPPTIYTYRMWIAVAIAICFLLTVIIEFPFVWFAFAKGQRPFGRVMWANVITQLATYVMCISIPFVLFSTDVRLASDVSIEQIENVATDQLEYWVYYIHPDDGNVWRIKPSAQFNQSVLECDLDRNDALLVNGSKDEELWSLFAMRASGNEPDQELIAEFSSRSSAFLDEWGEPKRPFLGVAPPADLRPIDARQWIVWPRFWSGLSASRFENDDVHRRNAMYGIGQINLEFTSVLDVWQAGNVTIIPGDYVVFEFGGQICLLDLPNRKLAMICRGYAPVVVPIESGVMSP